MPRIFKPTLKAAGKAVIGGSMPGTTMQELARSIIKPRRSIGTTVEAAMKHTGAQAVYAERRAAKAAQPTTPAERFSRTTGAAKSHRSAARRDLQPGEIRRATGGRPVEPGELIVDEPRLKVYKLKGGWSRVIYTDPEAANPVEFSIRSNEIKDLLEKKDTLWDKKPERIYSHWINTTEAGQLYTERRRVEGMLKIAVMTGDKELEAEIREVLRGSDKEVAAWRMRWLMDRTDLEIAEFYKYKERIYGSSQAVAVSGDDDIWM